MAGEYVGLVIGNDDPRTFTAGANLAQQGPALMSGDWKAIEASIARPGHSMSSRIFPAAEGIVEAGVKDAAARGTHALHAFARPAGLRVPLPRTSARMRRGPARAWW